MDIANNESFTTSLSGLMSGLKPIYKRGMDTILVGGYSLIIDLPARKTDCQSGCKYNPTYDYWIDSTGRKCRDCQGRGYTFETRQTIYKCNRRWTNEPFDKGLRGESTEGGRIYGNFVRTKTHISSFGHISKSLGATLDGQKIKLLREPRKVGWADENFYVISWWEKANKDING